jgi:hypothetical protein
MAALAADAGCAADAAAGGGSGNRSGPLCPQPPARPAPISARQARAAMRPRAGWLGFGVNMRDLSGPWRGPALCAARGISA